MAPPVHSIASTFENVFRKVDQYDSLVDVLRCSSPMKLSGMRARFEINWPAIRPRMILSGHMILLRLSSTPLGYTPRTRTISEQYPMPLLIMSFFSLRPKMELTHLLQGTYNFYLDQLRGDLQFSLLLIFQ